MLFFIADITSYRTKKESELNTVIQLKKQSRFNSAFSVRLSHFHGVARAYIICQYVLATFVIHIFKRTIKSYFINFFLPQPASPIRPTPKRSMVAGSGTGLFVDAVVLGEKSETGLFATAAYIQSPATKSE